MIKSFSSLLIATLLIMVLLVTSCGGTPSTTTPPTTTPTTTPPTTTPPTWGTLAGRGRGSFLGGCAFCHGGDGQGGEGPAIIGPSLRHFVTAQSLFNFISANMPWDSPGSLSIQSNLEILAFLLVESNFIQPEEVFDENNLANVLLNE